MTRGVMDNYPGGFTNGILVRGVPLNVAHPGKVFWVGNSATLQVGEKGASNGNKGGYYDPFSTIDYAVGMCAANRGDIIMVRPNHTETVSAAGGLDLDVAGIAIIGLGTGANRPTVNFTTATTADMDVDAANITMYNILFTGGVGALVAPIDVNAADFTLINCEYRDVTGQCVDCILTDNSADRFRIVNFRYVGDSAAGTNSGIALVGSDDVVIDGLFMDGNFAVGGIDIRTTAVTDLEVRNVVFRTRNAADIFLVDTVTGSTGMIGPNLYLRLQDNAANITEAITGATFVLFDDIFVVNNAGEKAMLINTTASTDA